MGQTSTPKRHLLIAIILAFIGVFCFACTENVYADLYIGTGGGDGGSKPDGSGSGCGKVNGQSASCPGSMWVYYEITDPSKDVYIGSADTSAADSITITGCHGYKGVWVLQYMAAGAGSNYGTLWYRAMTGALQVKSIIRSDGTLWRYTGMKDDGSGLSVSVTNSPKKGVYTALVTNATPEVYNYPACASDSNSKNWSCNSPGGRWMVSQQYVKDEFKKFSSDGTTNCTVGDFSGDCFGAGSPMSHFCSNPVKQPETKNTTIKSSASVGGVSGCDAAGASTSGCDGKTVNHDGSYSTASYSISFSHSIKFPSPSDYTSGNQSFHYKVERSVDGGAYASVEEDNASITPSGSFNSVSSHSVSVTLNNYGDSSTVCERLTVYPKSITFSVSGNTPDNGTLTTTICAKVTRSAPRTESVSAGAKAAVVNNGTARCSTAGYSSGSCNSTTYTHEGGSNVGSYNVEFAHSLIFPAPASGAFYSSSTSLSFNYTIYQKVDNGNWTALSSTGASGTASVTANGSYLSTFSHTAALSVATDSTSTICERIVATPKSYTFHEDGTSPSSDSDSLSAEVCTSVHRPAPTPVEISATTTAVADGNVITDPDTPLYSTTANSRTVDFKYAFTHDGASTLTLGTAYSVEYTIDGVRQTSIEHCASNKTACDITVPTNAYGQLSVSLAPGDVKKICSRVSFKSANYLIETDGTKNPQNDRGYSNWACVTFGRPGIREVNDGTIEITSSSSASVSGDAIWSDTHNVYLLTGQNATVNYSHKLSRGNVTYTDNSSTASPSVDVKYGLGRSQPASLSSTATVANNSSTTVNDSEAIGEIALATKVEKCQNIYFAYQQFTLRASYYYVGDKRYDGDGGNTILYPPLVTNNPGAVEGVASGTIRTPEYEFNTSYSKNVGSSDPAACATVLRPYNFNIDHITINKAQEEPVAPGAPIETTFQIHVGKNDSNFMITDIPDASIQVVKFVLTGRPANGSTAGAADVSTTPCAYFQNKIGASFFDPSHPCVDSVSASTQNIYPEGGTNSGNGWHTSDDYNKLYTYVTTMDNLPTTAKLCFAIAIDPTNSGPIAGDFNHNLTISDASCINIGKRPTLQVWGGNVYTTRGISTSTTLTSRNNTNLTFGSWGDYMLIAGGNIKGMASGASLISGVADPAVCKISPLTVANNQCNNKKIGESNVPSSYSLIQGIYDYYIQNSNNYTDIASKDLNSGSHVINTAVLNEAASNYPILIYNSDERHSNIYIESNISLGFSSRNYSDISIPQVIIYTPGDIYIDPSVSRLDAWLLAGGEIRTCARASGSSVRSGGSVSECETQLTITGPVVTSKLILDRTANGDAYVDTSGNSSIAMPAELFDFNPAAILFGRNEATNDSQPVTTYLHELPPRY